MVDEEKFPRFLRHYPVGAGLLIGFYATLAYSVVVGAEKLVPISGIVIVSMWAGWTLRVHTVEKTNHDKEDRGEEDVVTGE